MTFNDKSYFFVKTQTGMPDYQSILEELYRKYNPSKVGDVEFLLQKFRGREEELISKIRLKYGVKDPIVEVSPPEPKLLSPPATGLNTPLPHSSGATLIPEVSSGGQHQGAAAGAHSPGQGGIPAEDEARRARNRKRLKVALFALPGVIVLLVLVARGLSPLGGSQGAKENFRYVIADYVYAHNQADMGKDTRTVKLPFRTPLKVTGQEASFILTEIDGQTHYVPEIYLASKQHFYEISSFYNNEDAELDVDDSYEKRALRDYYEANQLMGKLSPELQKEFYGKETGLDVWQVVGVPEENHFRASATGTFAGGNYHRNEEKKVDQRPNDLALLITKMKNPEEQKLLLFTFEPGIERQAKMYPPLTLNSALDYKIKKYPYNDPLKLKFEGNAQNKLTKEKPGILLALPGSDAPSFLIVVEDGELVAYAEQEVETFRSPTTDFGGSGDEEEDDGEGGYEGDWGFGDASTPAKTPKTSAADRFAASKPNVNAKKTATRSSTSRSSSGSRNTTPGYARSNKRPSSSGNKRASSCKSTRRNPASPPQTTRRNPASPRHTTHRNPASPFQTTRRNPTSPRHTTRRNPASPHHTTRTNPASNGRRYPSSTPYNGQRYPSSTPHSGTRYPSPSNRQTQVQNIPPAIENRLRSGDFPQSFSKTLSEFVEHTGHNIEGQRDIINAMERAQRRVESQRRRIEERHRAILESFPGGYRP